MLSLDPGKFVFTNHPNCRRDFQPSWRLVGQNHLLILSAWGLSSPDELDLFLAAKGENLRKHWNQVRPALDTQGFLHIFEVFQLTEECRCCNSMCIGIVKFSFSEFPFSFFPRMQIVVFFDPSRNVHYNDFKVHFRYIPGKSKEFPEKTPRETGGSPSIIRNLLGISVGFRKILQPPRWASRDASRSLQRGIGTFGEVCSGGKIFSAAWDLTENHWRKGGRHFPIVWNTGGE